MTLKWADAIQKTVEGASALRQSQGKTDPCRLMDQQTSS
jgi:hypothetical protein